MVGELARLTVDTVDWDLTLSFLTGKALTAFIPEIAVLLKIVEVLVALVARVAGPTHQIDSVHGSAIGVENLLCLSSGKHCFLMVVISASSTTHSIYALDTIIIR